MDQATADSLWADIGVPLVIAVLAGAIAAFWPWLQSLQRGWTFHRMIRRELQEIGPFPETPVEGKPWWEHATKRFVHEEFFRRDNISENRDFILSLNPTVVYQVSQLWIALEKRDGHQWRHFLSQLANNTSVGSAALRKACKKWERILSEQNEGWLDTMGIPSVFRQDAVLTRASSLFGKRFEAYARLLPLTDYGRKEDPADLDPTARRELADRLAKWFYVEGAGLLLSGRALVQYLRVRTKLRETDSTPTELWKEFSQLRTDLKIDLGVRQPSERDVAMPWPEEERW